MVNKSRQIVSAAEWIVIVNLVVGFPLIGVAWVDTVKLLRELFIDTHAKRVLDVEVLGDLYENEFIHIGRHGAIVKGRVSKGKQIAPGTPITAVVGNMEDEEPCGEWSINTVEELAAVSAVLIHSFYEVLGSLLPFKEHGTFFGSYWNLFSFIDVCSLGLVEIDEFGQQVVVYEEVRHESIGKGIHVIDLILEADSMVHFEVQF